jgi:hypothetical protein
MASTVWSKRLQDTTDQLGKRFEPVRSGDRVEGVIAQRVDLESGSSALVE